MSLEANKLAAAVLVGGLLTLGIGIIADTIYKPGGEAHQASGEGAAAPEAAPATPATPSAEPAQSSVPLIAAADPAAGQKVFAKCATCHTADKGGPNRVGPNLWGVVGNKHAHLEGFAYSDAIKNMSDKLWTYEELDAFLTNPKAYAKGTKMTFVGLKKAEDRAALIRWLRDQSDQPLPLPAP